MARWFLLFVVPCACLVAAGCGGGGPKSDPPVKVSGTVKLDGKALTDGDIVFVGDPGSIPDALHITNGAFEGSVKPGKKRVEIRAYRFVKPPAGTTGITEDLRENLLPSRFNETSNLAAEVTADGLHPNHFDTQSR